MRIPRIGNLGGGGQVSGRVNLRGNLKGYLCGYPKSVTFGVGYTVSGGVHLSAIHRDTYADTPNR